MITQETLLQTSEAILFELKDFLEGLKKGKLEVLEGLKELDCDFDNDLQCLIQIQGEIELQRTLIANEVYRMNKIRDNYGVVELALDEYQSNEDVTYTLKEMIEIIITDDEMFFEKQCQKYDYTVEEKKEVLRVLRAIFIINNQDEIVKIKEA